MWTDKKFWRGTAVVAGLAAAAALAMPVAAEAKADVVTTDLGAVQGKLTADSRSFQGIPYAAAPVGRLRWVAPQPAKRWTGVRDATKPGSTCPQTGDFLGNEPSANEDCLYLNVTTPRRQSAKKLPVMVWIHGGGFYSGSGDVYDPRRLASAGDVLVVTVNYRLGALGFLAHPAFDGGRQLSGNFGLQDQQAALRWVRRNAAAFGGDARNVTIFGESAGGMSMCAQLAAPGSAGLFQRAIVQSGVCSMPWTDPETWTTRPRADAERKGASLASQLGCVTDVAACLRNAKVDKVLAVDHGYGFGPVVGGPVLPVSPTDAFRTGRFNRVPVLHGITRDEHSTFVIGQEILTNQPFTPADYAPRLGITFGPQTGKVLARYPQEKYVSTAAALADVYTDAIWGCPADRTNADLAGQVPTYAYEFADRETPWFTKAPKPSFAPGAFHAGELQYLFDWPESGKLSAAQQRLSAQMMRYWVNFARTGNPNGAGLSPWQRYRTADRYVQSLAPGSIVRTDLAANHKCTFWRSIGW